MKYILFWCFISRVIWSFFHIHVLQSYFTKRIDFRSTTDLKYYMVKSTPTMHNEWLTYTWYMYMILTLNTPSCHNWAQALPTYSPNHYHVSVFPNSKPNELLTRAKYKWRSHDFCPITYPVFSFLNLVNPGQPGTRPILIWYLAFILFTVGTCCTPLNIQNIQWYLYIFNVRYK